jgi:hypothetical protein
MSSILLASAAGCARTLAAGMGMHQDQVSPISETRTARQGVCAYVDTGSFVGDQSSVKACARAFGNDKDQAERAVLFSEFSSTGSDRWNPGNWHIVVTAPDGIVLLDTTFPKSDEPSTLAKAGCLLSTCITMGRNSQRFSVPWTSGTYRLHYTYLPDSKPVEMTITLQ